MWKALTKGGSDGGGPLDGGSDGGGGDNGGGGGGGGDGGGDEGGGDDGVGGLRLASAATAEDTTAAVMGVGRAVAVGRKSRLA